MTGGGNDHFKIMENITMMTINDLLDSSSLAMNLNNSLYMGEDEMLTYYYGIFLCPFLCSCPFPLPFLFTFDFIFIFTSYHSGIFIFIHTYIHTCKNHNNQAAGMATIIPQEDLH